MSLDLATAQKIVSAALAHARGQGFEPLAVAVLDARAALIAYAAEDGTSLGRAAIATAKANGALSMGFGSRTLAARAKLNPTFVTALTHILPGGAAPAPGGVLIRGRGGEVLGAVGVSGDVSDKDEAAAIAGIEAAGLKADPGAD